jgi:pimeloyl-ACP methyl ester carboxylesterase
MADIVLVPGSWQGGCYFSPIVPALRDAGHNVFPVTPTGVGDRRHLTSGAINLDTHIQDVVNTFEIEGIDDAVLVGHSYGGMVITGVSSRLPGRIRSLVYLDALLPQDGQSAWDLIIEPVRRKYLATTEDGLTHIPPPELGKRVPPHPLATYFQPLRLAPSTFAVLTRCMSGRKTIRKPASTRTYLQPQ